MSQSETFANWLDHSPEIFAILMLLTGWLLGLVLRHAVTVGVPWINKASARWSSRPTPLLSAGFTRFLKALVLWGAVLTSVVLALSMLSGGELSVWLNVLLKLLSRLLVALGIIVVGHILGRLTRRLLGRLSLTADIGELPRIAYWFVVGLAAVTAMQQLGLDVSFLTRVLLAVIIVSFAGLALAFAHGARTLVANLAAQGELQRYKTGDRLIVDGVEGKVLEIHRTGMVLSTEHGLASVPAAKFAETTVIASRTGGDEDG